MVIHSWRHPTPSHRIDHDTSPMVPLYLAGRPSRRFSPGSRQSSRKPYPDISQGLRTLSSREEHRVTSCLQVPSSNRTVPGYSRCWELRGKCSYSRTLLLSHTHQKLISFTTVERTAHGGTGGHAAHCSCITTGARSWNSAELPWPVNAYAPNQQPNEAERVGRVRGREAGFEWELSFGDPGPEDFALDTIAIVEYSIGFNAGKSTCRPRRVRCLQVLPVTRNVLNEGMVAGTIWVSHT